MNRNIIIGGIVVLAIIAGAAFFLLQPEELEPLIISTIPSQSPEILAELHGNLAVYLEAELGIPVEYRPTATYDNALRDFRFGDIGLAWLGGLSGVQARLSVEDAEVIAQRNTDATSTSIFIANVSTGLEPFNNRSGLTQLSDFSFTFGSSGSTSGRLMPQYFLGQAGVTEDDFSRPFYFSGSHDATIDAIESGEFEVGVVYNQVWNARVASGDVDLDNIVVLWESPTFFDSHWVLHPTVVETYGEDIAERIQTALFSLDSSVPAEAAILDGFGAEAFIITENANYEAIEAIGREIGEIRD